MLRRWISGYKQEESTRPGFAKCDFYLQTTLHNKQNSKTRYLIQHMEIYQDDDNVMLVQISIWGIFPPKFQKNVSCTYLHYTQFFTSDCLIAMQIQ
jgi:hypothetical protein